MKGVHQTALFCGCGSSSILAKGLCGQCYYADYRSRRHFGGHRQQVLARDRRRCTACGSGTMLVVHHRQPGRNSASLFATLCRICHARVHRMSRLRYGLNPHIQKLWRELNREQAEQLELPLLVEASPVDSPREQRLLLISVGHEAR